jgi:hypothetical protein
MEICQEDHALAAGGDGLVLQFHVIADGAKVIAEMRLTGWLDAGYDTHSYSLSNIWKQGLPVRPGQEGFQLKQPDQNQAARPRTAKRSGPVLEKRNPLSIPVALPETGRSARRRFAGLVRAISSPVAAGAA